MRHRARRLGGRIMPGLLLCLLALTLAAPAPAQTPDEVVAAVVVFVQGDVTIASGAGSTSATFGASLHDGDLVATGPDAKVSLLLESGQMLELGPESRIQVSGAVSGSADLVATVPEDLAPAVSRFSGSTGSEEGLAALPQLRNSGEGIVLYSPRHTRVRSSALHFRWSDVEDALEYRVHLAGPGGSERDYRSPSATFALPEDEPLPAGSSWDWRIEAVTEDGVVASEAYSFEVATQEQAAEIETMESALEPLLGNPDAAKADAARYALARYCRDRDFVYEAIEHLELLAARWERDDLTRELATLYQHVGRDPGQ